jgi:hypothetical protein
LWCLALPGVTYSLQCMYLWKNTTAILTVTVAVCSPNSCNTQLVPCSKSAHTQPQTLPSGI